MNKQPWPARYVEHGRPSSINVADYARILEAAVDERPLQEFLAMVPSFLRMLVPSCVDFWCWDRPSLEAAGFPWTASRVS